jgi:hypothetical protein
MTDKYTLSADYSDEPSKTKFTLYDKGKIIASITCDQDIALFIDACLNQTSRAGSKTSQAKRDAAKRNIQKRWQKK